MEGCNASSDASALAGDASERSEEPPASADNGAFGESDAGAVPEAPYRGSPLCKVASGTTCMPDDDETKRTYGAAQCSAAPDAGASDGGRDDEAAVGCRLEGKDATPTCLEAARAPDGGDGVRCSTGSECAPGFDCVAGEGGGTCRRYCCTGTCASARSMNGGETFCDLQKLASNGVAAPVCMPIKKCTLFVPGQCADDETCAVVSENGVSGCVARGTGDVGDTCDEQNCRDGLTCLGQPGTRHCYKLCQTTGAPACDAPQVCQTSTVFQDPTVGICVAPR